VHLRQLEIISAIAETGSFTAAGRKLHVSQSAISRQVLLLEDELGEEIFHRIGRRVRITPAGDALLQLSHRISQDVHDTLAEIGERHQSPRGTLRLVGGMTVCLYVFPVLLAELRRLHPKIEVRVTGGSADKCVAELRAGLADLGMLTLPIASPDLTSVPLLQEELLIVAEPRHPLASVRRPTAADLARQPFILFERGSNTRRVIDAFFLQAQIEPRIVMETENVEIIKAMVRAGLGIGIVPYQAVAADIAAHQLFHSRVAGAELIRETGWIYPKMSRLPRAVSEVMAVFETIRPKLRFAPHRRRS